MHGEPMQIAVKSQTDKYNKTLMKRTAAAALLLFLVGCATPACLKCDVRPVRPVQHARPLKQKFRIDIHPDGSRELYEQLPGDIFEERPNWQPTSGRVPGVKANEPAVLHVA